MCLELKQLASHQHRRIFVNTSNTVFIDAIKQREPESDPYESLTFEFHTNGENVGVDIAQDLLPHGISLLIHLFGECDINDFSSQVSGHVFTCKFCYGGCSVIFDFREHPDGPRHMRIGLNGDYYNRVQVGSGSDYRVSLVNQSNGIVIPVIDPFRSYIERFLTFVKSSGTKENDDFLVGALNMQLMARCLSLTEQHI